MSTRQLPTDKNGNVYYGPKTVAQAESQIASICDAESELPLDVQSDARTLASEIAEKMKRAGYTRAASNLLKQYGN